MLKSILLLSIVFTVGTVIGQKKYSLPNNSISFKCGFFYNQNEKTYTPPDALQVSEKEAIVWMKNIVDDILKIIGLQNRYLLRSIPALDNCQATCYNNEIGQDRYIEFGRPFLIKYQEETKNKWFVVGVVAHELGHHLNGHSIRGYGSRPNIELEADEFAGFILQKLGSSLENAQGIFSFLDDEAESSFTHPSKKLRYAAIKRGWDKAANNTTLETLSFNDADYFDLAMQNLEKSKQYYSMEEKLPYLNAALQILPNHAETLSEKGKLFTRENQLDSAKYYLESALDNDGGILNLYFNYAKYFIAIKNYTKALEIADDVLKYKPSYEGIYLLKAEIYNLQKKYNEALLAAHTAVAITKEMTKMEALLLRSQIYSNMKNYKLAMKDALDADKVNPYGLSLEPLDMVNKIKKAMGK
jgi:tetratricopeptide (TPR) repeat protein